MLAAHATLPAGSFFPALLSGRKEHRMSYRAACRIRLVHAAAADAGGALGETVNLSSRGIAVRVGAAFEQGASVEVLLPIGGEPICLYGRVAHRRRVTTGTYELGIRLDSALTVQ